MKRFRVMYFFGSCITECYITAKTEAEAVEKFKAAKGDRTIYAICF